MMMDIDKNKKQNAMKFNMDVYIENNKKSDT